MAAVGEQRDEVTQKREQREGLKEAGEEWRREAVGRREGAGRQRLRETRTGKEARQTAALLGERQRAETPAEPALLC